MTTELQHNFARVNSVRLHYVTAGAGPLILFLHGFPEFWYAWKGQLTEFASDHQCVALDMRGYNLSEKPADIAQYDLKVLVEDIRAFVNYLAHGEKLVLVAHDWGGVVAWAFAAACPEALEKLVIINAPHPAIFARLLSSNPAQQAASQYMLMFRSDRAEQILSANEYDVLSNMIMSFGSKDGLPPEDKPEYIKAWSQPGALTGGLNYYRASRIGPPTPGEAASIDRFRPDPSFLKVQVNTLVIWGEKDPALVVQNLDGLSEFVPRLTIKRIPDATHWLIHTHATEVNGFIREFIR